MFELYNLENKIPKEKYDKIYQIIIDNYFERNKDLISKRKEIDTEEAYNNWVKTITTTEDYNIILYYLNNDIVAFVAFTYVTDGLCLSEVQIKKEYQGKLILKQLLKEVLKNCKKSKSKKILGTINPNNKKSIQVFTHIGLKNTINKWYEISYNDLEKWINNN